MQISSYMNQVYLSSFCSVGTNRRLSQPYSWSLWTLSVSSSLNTGCIVVIFNNKYVVHFTESISRAYVIILKHFIDLMSVPCLGPHVPEVHALPYIHFLWFVSDGDSLRQIRSICAYLVYRPWSTSQYPIFIVRHWRSKCASTHILLIMNKSQRSSFVVSRECAVENALVKRCFL